jgi:hypothetical protein
MAMAMAVTMTVESMQPATEPAICCAAIPGPPSVGVGPSARSAILPPHKTHRYGADGGGTHHRQNDTARAFQGTVSKDGLEQAEA